jgi:hypothetical protein
MENVPYFGPSHPNSDDAQPSREDVKEPPLPQAEEIKQKSPNERGIGSAVEDGARIN